MPGEQEKNNIQPNEGAVDVEIDTGADAGAKNWTYVNRKDGVITKKPLKEIV